MRAERRFIEGDWDDLYKRLQDLQEIRPSLRGGAADEQAGLICTAFRDIEGEFRQLLAERLQRMLDPSLVGEDLKDEIFDFGSNYLDHILSHLRSIRLYDFASQPVGLDDLHSLIDSGAVLGSDCVAARRAFESRLRDLPAVSKHDTPEHEEATWLAAAVLTNAVAAETFLRKSLPSVVGDRPKSVPLLNALEKIGREVFGPLLGAVSKARYLSLWFEYSDWPGRGRQ